jgi:hypothetical protein
MAILKSSRTRSTKNAGTDVVKSHVNDNDVSDKNVVVEVKQQEDVRDEQNVEVAKDSGREETTTAEDDPAFGFLGNLFNCNCGRVNDVAAANDVEEAKPKVNVEIVEDKKGKKETDEAKAENEGGESATGAKKVSKKEAKKAATEEAKKAAAARKQEQIAAAQAKKAAREEAKKEAAARKQAQMEAKKAAKDKKNKKVVTDPPTTTVKSTKKNEEEVSIGKLLKQLGAHQKHLNEIEMNRAKAEENLLSTKKKIKAATTDAELDAILHVPDEDLQGLLSLNTSSEASSIHH